ncbi:MAG: DMT family transporter [Clostridia bacterium]|nr:DMT family transporter [Clostridia bacterium]
MKKKSLLGHLILLLGAVIWGGAFIAQRTGVADLGPLTLNGIRSFAGSALLFLVILVRSRVTKKPIRLEKKTFLLSIGCGVALFLASATQQIGIVTVEAGRAGFLTALYILLVPLIRFAFGKRIRPQVAFAVLLGLCGLYLLCSGNGSLFGAVTTGDLWLLACAFFFSVQIILVDVTGKDCDPLLLTAIEFLVAGILSVAPALLSEGLPSAAALRGSLVELLYLSVFSSAIGYTLQAVGQKLSGQPATAALIMSTESVFATLFGVLLLHEQYSAREYLGCAVLFAAILLAQIELPEKKKKTPPEEPNAG